MKNIRPFLLILALAVSACAGPQAASTSSTAVPTRNETKSAASLPSATPVKEAQPTPGTSSGKEEGCSPIGINDSLIWTDWIASKHQNQIYPLDPANGLPTCGYDRLLFRDFIWTAFSADGNTLAIVDYASETYQDGRLHFVDLQSWTAVTATLSIMKWVSSMSFNPGATQLAIAYAAPNSPPGAAQPYILAVVDRLSGTLINQQVIDFNPSLLEYTPDSKSLVAFGAEENYLGDALPLAQLLVFNASDYSIAWQPSLGAIRAGVRQRKDTDIDYLLDQWGPAAVLSSDGRELYIVHADEEKLTRVDLVNFQMKTVEIQPKRSWLERLLSAGTSVAYAKGINGTTKQAILLDGRIFVTGLVSTMEKDSAGNWQFNQTSIGLQVIDAASGELLDKMASEASQFELSPAQDALYLEGWTDNSPWTEVVSTRDLKVIRRLPGYNLKVASRPGGGKFLLATGGNFEVTSLAAVDPAALAGKGELQLKPWSALGYPLLSFP